MRKDRPIGQQDPLSCGQRRFNTDESTQKKLSLTPKNWCKRQFSLIGAMGDLYNPFLFREVLQKGRDLVLISLCNPWASHIYKLIRGMKRGLFHAFDAVVKDVVHIEEILSGIIAVCIEGINHLLKGSFRIAAEV